jgi:hypothetical protein
MGEDLALLKEIKGVSWGVSDILYDLALRMRIP